LLIAALFFFFFICFSFTAISMLILAALFIDYFLSLLPLFLLLHWYCFTLRFRHDFQRFYMAARGCFSSPSWLAFTPFIWLFHCCYMDYYHLFSMIRVTLFTPCRRHYVDIATITLLLITYGGHHAFIHSVIFFHIEFLFRFTDCFTILLYAIVYFHAIAYCCLILSLRLLPPHYVIWLPALNDFFISSGICFLHFRSYFHFPFTDCQVHRLYTLFARASRVAYYYVIDSLYYFHLCLF